MTTTMPPNGPGSRRGVPTVPSDAQRALLRNLLRSPDHWVLRAEWDRFLDDQDRSRTVAIASLTRDQRIAARAWLRQQRHRLHAVTEGGDGRAPDGWLEALPLYDALGREA